MQDLPPTYSSVLQALNLGSASGKTKLHGILEHHVIAQAAITKHHRLGGLRTEIYFSQFWGLQVRDQGVA